jgi:hypothetical protein
MDADRCDRRVSHRTGFGRLCVVAKAGSAVGLHPVWLMFSLIAFGYLLGFVGLLVAIPLAASIGVLARFALRKYMESPLYTGKGSG